MTCSSNTICRPEGSLNHGRQTWARWAVAALPVLVAAPLAFVWMPEKVQRTDSVALIERARAALDRGDGIDAEMKLRAALDRGASRSEIAAWMGEAYLVQGNREKAHEWLEGDEFSPESAASGWRALAALERLDGNLPAAGKAYDNALAITPDDAALWVEIGRLRYAGGEHLQAIEAARHALELSPDNVRALEFGGQLMRDRHGLVAALPWFEKAIGNQPDDVPVLLEYAATLGDLGRASECLEVTRRVLEISPGNPRAFYFQAVLAARARDYALSRALLNRTGSALDEKPGALLLRGVVELAAGNPSAAAEALEQVLQLRPDDRNAQDLLARAIYLAGEYRYLTLRFRDRLNRDDASPYLLTVVARAHEALGERYAAGELLDRAAEVRSAALRVLPSGNSIGGLLAAGGAKEAEVRAEAARQDDPGFYDNLSLAGDVQLALGNARAAQERYVAAARIRMPASLFERRVQAYLMGGDPAAAGELVERYLHQHPTSRAALRAAARHAVAGGDTARALAILRWLRANGGARDVGLLSELALIEAEAGDIDAAAVHAREAYRLQRASPVATQALAFVIAERGEDSHAAGALLNKASAMLGDTPLSARTRRILATRDQD